MMKLTLLALLTLLAVSPKAHGAARDATDAYSELPPGRYSMAITGMMSTVCARAIAAEWKKLPEVDKAVVDFDKEIALVTIGLDKTLPIAALHKALRRAEKLANLGSHYEMRDVKYLP